MEYQEALQWYWELVCVSSDALAGYEFDGFQFYEDWRRDLKGGMLYGEPMYSVRSN